MNDSIDPVRPYRQLARNNRLANLRLLDACARLQPGEFEAEGTSFFPSIRATLNHILTIDWFYVDALEGGTLGPAAWAVEEPCATPAELRAEQARVDERLIAFCEALMPERLGAEVRIHRQGRIQVRERRRYAAASVPARCPSSRPGACHARRNLRQAAPAR
jgi:uncharacterized damage-inducible protein DinB